MTLRWLPSPPLDTPRAALGHPLKTQGPRPVTEGASARAEQPTGFLYRHHVNPEILIEPHQDGGHYIRICAMHQWASVPLPDLVYLPGCPGCALEGDVTRGHQRYVRLKARVAGEAVDGGHV